MVKTTCPATAKAIENFLREHDPEEVIRIVTDVFLDYIKFTHKVGFTIDFGYYVDVFRDLMQVLEVAKREKNVTLK